jgi:hypothetical protein
MFDHRPTAAGLPLGRPKNRTRTYAGDRRAIADEKPLWGPDAHGVYWRPQRAYYEPTARGGVGETLVVIAPVHPEELGLQ